MLRLFVLLLGLAAAPAWAQAPDTTEPATVHHVFDVFRDGNKIGTTTIDIGKDGDTTTVNLKTHISVVVLFVEAYRYDSNQTEVWKAGHFVSYTANTDDHGTKRSISAVADGDKFELTVNGDKRELPHVILPASLWDDDFIGQTQLFDADKGTIMSVTVTDLGDAPISLNGDKIKTHHYRISGDFPRDVWLSGDLPIRIKLIAPDHSTIISKLRQQ